ncbi:MAG: zinc ribbon domain-containing protein [Actinomycetia bacterium]|nr:zinc ribbon domain-containing protein [Actinomycetes bacterium]
MHDESVRYRLDQRRATALLQLTGVVPDGRFIDPAEPLADPVAQLNDQALLDETSGRPVPVLDNAMRIVAAPARVLTVRINVPGIDEWDLAHVAAGSSGGPYVMVTTAGDVLDILVMSSEYEVAALLDGLLDLTTLPTRPVTPDAVLSFAAWVGMLAVVDVHRRAGLKAELDRRPATDGPFDAADMRAELEAGLAGSDTRWAITAFTPLSPVDLRAARPTGSAITQAMIDAALVEADGQRWVLTELGNNLAELFGSVIKWGGVTLTFTGSKPDVRMGELSVLRSTFRLGLGFWNGEGGTFEVALVEPDSETAVEMLRRMLLLPNPEPAPRPDRSRCPRCSAAVDEGQQFCRACGESLQGVIVPPAECPSCGTKVDSAQDSYCSECGGPLTPAASEWSET